MEHESLNRLSRIPTLWTVVCKAREGPGEEARNAQQELLRRYGRAVHRYLLGALRDPHAADELGQEFALRFLRGDLRGVRRERGRFRDFVTGVLFHLIADHHRRLKRQFAALPGASVEPAAPGKGPAETDPAFVETWRDELLDRAWKALAALQEQTGQPFHTVLRCRADHPDLRSKERAERLSTLLAKPVTAVWERQTLRRARDKFADLLLAEVAQTLDSPTAEAIEEELLELGLLACCQPALDRYRAGS
jgi:DNA-directed RNA polymerase specialized sigma24 family protein